jgi:hypothetical protein
MRHATWNIGSLYGTGLFTVDNEIKTNSRKPDVDTSLRSGLHMLNANLTRCQEGVYCIGKKLFNYLTFTIKWNSLCKIPNSR